MFMTQQELADFTGYTKPSAQIRWLKAKKLGYDGALPAREETDYCNGTEHAEEIRVTAWNFSDQKWLAQKML